MIILNDHDNTNIASKFIQLAPNIKPIDKDRMMMIGSPIWEESIESCWQSKLSGLKRMAERLVSLDDHDSLFLLKNCLAIPKLTYILRYSPCYNSNVLQEYDKVLIETLEKVLNVSIDGNTWV